MDTVKVRNVILGEGKPKICTSITGITEQQIYEEAELMKSLPCDIVEWRVDWFDGGLEKDAIVQVLAHLYEILGDKPLIFTIRTSREGGEKSYTKELYKEIIIAATKSGFLDIADVELFMGNDIVMEIINEVHKSNKLVIASNHEFVKTPPKEELVSRLLKMQELNADVLKIAVMPQNTQDVLTLLDVTREMNEKEVKKPIVTMSMSKLGMISRIAGETFGSAMTFGAGEKASAPGQLDVNELSHILDLLHR